MEERLGLKDKELLPMWVADMDFQIAQPIIDAIVKKAQHGIIGYAGGFSTYYDAVIHWMKNHHHWNVEKEWIVPGTTVVAAMHRIVRAFTHPGDKVIVQTPIYSPFFAAVRNNGCHIVENPLKFNGMNYEMDFEDLEKKINSRVKLLLLCSPHNPTGRVWRKEELKKLGEICLAHDILIVSDEIHFDLIFKEHKHNVLATVSEDIAQNCIICTSPHKTFNIAGLDISNAIIPNERIRNIYRKALENEGINKPNVFGIVGLRAAYEEGEGWLEQLMSYVESNLKFLMAFIEERLPKLKVIQPEGTYLVWIDCKGLGLTQEEMEVLLHNKGKIVVNQGNTFGSQGEGFIRMNIACPRATLEEGLKRLEAALSDL